MIICQVLLVVVANPILLDHMKNWEWQKLNVLLKKHALELWTRVVTRKEPIASVKRDLFIPLANRVYTKRRNTAVSTYKTTQCIVYMIQIL